VVSLGRVLDVSVRQLALGRGNLPIDPRLLSQLGLSCPFVRRLGSPPTL
jgi:hypothetical protein